MDKSEVPNESDFKTNGQDESISGMLDIELMMMMSWKCFILFLMFFSVFLCKVAKQNQVFHKYKPEAKKSLRCEFLEKNNSIERLNSSLSSGKSQWNEIIKQKKIKLFLFHNLKFSSFGTLIYHLWFSFSYIDLSRRYYANWRFRRYVPNLYNFKSTKWSRIKQKEGQVWGPANYQHQQY